MPTTAPTPTFETAVDYLRMLRILCLREAIAYKAVQPEVRERMRRDLRALLVGA